MRLKILHFADLHLEKAFGDTGIVSSKVGRQRRIALRDVLRGIVDKAQELQVDYLTVGGDLYEHDRATTDTGAFLQAQFERLDPIRVIIAPGNHDPDTVDSLYRRVAWSPNVTVIHDAKVTRAVCDPGVNIYGAAHTTPSVTDNLVRGLRLDTDAPNVLLLHASVGEQKQTYRALPCPLSPRDIRQAGFSLALLGHYHKSRIPDIPNSMTIDGVPVIYPGTPEPLGFDDAGPRYAVLVTIDDTEIHFEKVQTNRTCFTTGSIDVSEFESRRDIASAIHRWARATKAKCYVRLDLVGDLSATAPIDVEWLYHRCADDFAYLLIRDQTRPRLGISPDEPTVRGRFVKRMQRRIQGAASEQERAELERALLYGLDALEGREVNMR